MNVRSEGGAIRQRGREAGAAVGAEAGGGGGCRWGAVNPGCLIALWAMASCQQR